MRLKMYLKQYNNYHLLSRLIDYLSNKLFDLRFNVGDNLPEC
jgi:hypothetical protein